MKKYKYQLRINEKNEILEIREESQFIGETTITGLDRFLIIENEKPDLHKLKISNYYGYNFLYENGEILENKSETYLKNKREFFLNRIRSERNKLLLETDFTILPDSPYKEEDKEAIKFYRKQLRDLPQILENVEDLENVTFPEKPLCLIKKGE